MSETSVIIDNSCETVNSAVALPRRRKNASVSVTWYTLRFFGGGLDSLTSYLDREGISYYVPMIYKSAKGNDRTSKTCEPVPAFAHLLFVRKDRTLKSLLATLSHYPYPVKIYRYTGCREAYEISDSDMQQLRTVCDHAPEFELIDIEKSSEPVKDGERVIITKGPCKGIVGTLSRKKIQHANPDGTISKSKFYYVQKVYCCALVRIRVIHGMFEKILVPESV